MIVRLNRSIGQQGGPFPLNRTIQLHRIAKLCEELLMNDRCYDTPTEDVRLSQSELARLWNVSPRCLEKWRQLGVGPDYLKIGGRVRYRLADVRAYEAASLRRHG
jgi:hypothetical protein